MQSIVSRPRQLQQPRLVLLLQQLLLDALLLLSGVAVNVVREG